MTTRSWLLPALVVTACGKDGPTSSPLTLREHAQLYCSQFATDLAASKAAYDEYARDSRGTLSAAETDSLELRFVVHSTIGRRSLDGRVSIGPALVAQFIFCAEALQQDPLSGDDDFTRQARTFMTAEDADVIAKAVDEMARIASRFDQSSAASGER